MIDECALMRQELKGDNREWLVHPKIIKVSKRELIKQQLKWILHNYKYKGKLIKLNDKDLTILSFVYKYGINAPSMCVEQGFYEREKSVENAMSRLRACNLIVGVRENTKINPLIRVTEGNISFTVKYEVIDND